MDTATRNSNADSNDPSHAFDGLSLTSPPNNAVATSRNSSVLEMQTGLFQLGRKRALSSGITESLPEDAKALTHHAWAMARDTYRDLYDPTRNTHDSMHQAEYEKVVMHRDEAERAEEHASANLRDAEIKVAATPKAGPRPSAHTGLVAAFIVAITVTIAPTLHDSVFHSLSDEMLIWCFSLLSAAFVAAMLTLAILTGRSTKWTWVGMLAGVVLGSGLGAVRLSYAENASEVAFGAGLTAVEVAAVILLEWLARGLRSAEVLWSSRNDGEQQALATRDAADTELLRRQARVKDANESIMREVAFVEDRHNRHIHIAELEEVAIKATLDGYNSGIAENIGRLRGVRRGTP
jgi:hypothetical protein